MTSMFLNVPGMYYQLNSGTIKVSKQAANITALDFYSKKSSKHEVVSY
jgi:hypothetical protein